MAMQTNTMVLNKTIEPMHSHRSRHREQPIWPHSDNHTLVGYWEINGVKAHCLLDSRSEGVLLSPEFTQATGIKTFALEKPIALQLACISSQLMINYGTHTTIKIGRKGKHPHPRMRMWGRSSIPLRGTSGCTRHTKIETPPSMDTDRCLEHLRAALSMTSSWGMMTSPSSAGAGITISLT